LFAIRGAVSNGIERKDVGIGPKQAAAVGSDLGQAGFFVVLVVKRFGAAGTGGIAAIAGNERVRAGALGEFLYFAVAVTEFQNVLLSCGFDAEVFQIEQAVITFVLGAATGERDLFWGGPFKLGDADAVALVVLNA
jgi:hypothetical protein